MPECSPRARLNFGRVSAESAPWRPHSWPKIDAAKPQNSAKRVSHRDFSLSVGKCASAGASSRRQPIWKTEGEGLALYAVAVLPAAILPGQSKVHSVKVYGDVGRGMFRIIRLFTCMTHLGSRIIRFFTCMTHPGARIIRFFIGMTPPRPPPATKTTTRHHHHAA